MTATRPGPPKKSVSPTPKPKPEQKQQPTPTPTPTPPPRWRWIVPAAITIAFIALLFYHPGSGGKPTQALSYTSFVTDVTTNKVSTAAITSAGAVSGTLRGGSAYTSQIPVRWMTPPFPPSCSATRSR
jgi:cell division protease FtsH